MSNTKVRIIEATESTSDKLNAILLLARDDSRDLKEQGKLSEYIAMARIAVLIHEIELAASNVREASAARDEVCHLYATEIRNYLGE